jgi:hypothetical protein
MYVSCNTETRSRNHFCRGKLQVLNLQSACVCFVALVIRHTKRMRRITLLHVAYLALSNFSTLSHKRHDFRGESIEYKMRVLIFSTNMLILREILRDIIILVDVRGYSRKVRVIPVRF